MQDTKLFQIGDVARMFHLSVGSLRHYEREGLLTPEHIDRDTGYRYYSVRQFEVLNTICYLRALDMPLHQIADFLQNKDVDVIADKLLKQKEIVVAKQQQLRTIERKIDHRLQQLQDARAAELNEIKLIKTPACRGVWIRDSLAPKSYLDLEHSIRKLEADQQGSVVFLGKVGIGILKENLQAEKFERYDLVFLLLDEEDDYEGQVEQWPECTCVSIHFCGGHQEAAKQYQKLMAFIKEHKLEIVGFSREVTLIDNGITKDSQKFVTEIRIPVEKFDR